MDGHDRGGAFLEARDLRLRKGAPATFDVAGEAHTLDRLRGDEENEVAVPVDRRIGISRDSSRPIPAPPRAVVTGGDLLLDEAPSAAPADRFDPRVWNDVPMKVLERRRTRRWTRIGLKGAALQASLEGDDLPNAQRAATAGRAADPVLRASRAGTGD